MKWFSVLIVLFIISCQVGQSQTQDTIYIDQDLKQKQNSNIAAYKYSLEQNYPNPFNPSTKINFSLKESGLVTLKIYNLLGEEIITLINSEMNECYSI